MVRSKRALFLFIVLAALRNVTVGPAGAGEPSSRRPNLLFILMDNIGQDWFGCYGSVEGQTPEIDKLAESGVQFRHCYVMPLCSTSRHVLLTGRYPFRTGWTIHHDAAIYGGGYFDPNREVTFARGLRSASYATAIAGKWQINNLFDQPDALEKHGFDEHCVFPEGPRGHPAHTKRYWDPYVIQNGRRVETDGEFGPKLFTDYLIDFMRRNRDRPFLAFYSTVLTHLPATTTPLNENEDLTERQKLAGMVRYADHCVGRLVRALDALKLRDRTIVFITTDNGTPAVFGGKVRGRVFQAAADTMVEGDMKEGSIDVPLVVNCPALVPGGRVSDALVDSSDVLPTLLELAGAGRPEGVTLDGRSFAAILRGAPDTASPREWIFSQYADKRLVRNRRFKLRSDGRFHDLLRDPLEKYDLSKSEDAEVVAERARLQQVLDSLPPDAKLWFEPRSISARRLKIGDASRRAADDKLAPEDPTADEPGRYPVPAECMHPEQGHCYIASMDFGEEGDKLTGNRSMLMLFEDGNPLGPPRSIHADIREGGGGRFSHWTRETLYFSASDNTDPRSNGRRYEVASRNPKSTLGGLDRFPAVETRHVELVTSGRHEYAVEMGGTLDMENTKTLPNNNCYIAFQNNVALTIENVGEVPVVNPRLVINDRGNWYTFKSLLEEFTRGAATDQEKVYLIWENMRRNLYHESPLFGDAEPHDPVKLFNVYGLNLCDDAGNAGSSLFHHAGLVGSKNRALHGHVQCEAFVGGAYQFMDVDMDCFYLDRENELPVSGDACARDHDLVRRELNYGPVVARFTPSDMPAALFGPDDSRHDAQLRGHEIAYTLRPGEKVVFRWDNIGKYCAENRQRAHRPKYFGNSKFVYRPRLALDATGRDACSVEGLIETTASGQGGKLAARSPAGHLDYEIKLPYPACGGTVRATFVGLEAGDEFSVSLSLDGEKWTPLWANQGAGSHEAEVALDQALDVHNKPAKYGYFVRVGLGSSGAKHGANLCSLEIETDVLAAPVSLPRLTVGANRALYWDETEGERQVRITHEWRESDAVRPLAGIEAPDYPRPGSQIKDSIVTFSWPAVEGADRYHLQVSRRADFQYPYRTSLDVIIPTAEWTVPFTGIFSPDTTYYWRLRCRDHWGVWGDWSRPWTFTWQGPRVPVNLRFEQQRETLTLHWEPNPRGERPVRYEVYGSDEKGFSIHKDEHDVPGRGKVPGNFLAETTATSMVVVSPAATAANANKAFYRVVAIDAGGTQSGCSDYAELPHPLVYTKPVTSAKVGREYRYEIKSLRSLGDYQCKQDPAVEHKEYAYRFWDIEENAFKLLDGPPWLILDAESGVLSGTPTATDIGTAPVQVEVINQFGARAGQEFELTVSR